MRTRNLVLALAVLASPVTASPLQTALRPADAEPELRFGAAVALAGPRLLVGAPGQPAATPAGRAYVFRSEPGGWIEEARLDVLDPREFGKAVALVGDLAFVGDAKYPDQRLAPGAVFVFERTAGSWGAPTVLRASDAATSTDFGVYLAAEPGRLLVAGRKQVYVFELQSGAWTETAILPGGTTVFDIAVSGSRALIGSNSPGRAVLFEHSPVTGWDAGTPLGSNAAGYTSRPPACGSDLEDIENARLTSAAFRPGSVGEYELRFQSLLTAGLQPRVRMLVEGDTALYFELAWPQEFEDDGAAHAVALRLPGIEFAIGQETRFEFLLNGLPDGTSPTGWWIDDVELVPLP